MSGQDEREFLLSVFLMEAWDTLASLEAGLARVAGERGPGWSGPASEALEELKVITHRLRGSAGLHGFPRVSAVAAMMEQIVERLASAGPGDHARAVETLAELAAALRGAFDAIGASGREDADALAAAMTRHAAALTAAPPVAPSGEPAAVAASHAASLAPSAGTGEAGADDAVFFDDPVAAALREAPADVAPPVDPELDAVAPAADGESAELERFYAENPDVVSYFVPEANEHLELANASLLSLEQKGRNEADLTALFRAVHTLKGAAYTVGCPAIGRLAHKIEDLLGAAREGSMPLTPALVDAVFTGADALKLMVQRADGPVPALSSAVATARAKLDAVMTPALEGEAAEPVVAAVAPDAAAGQIVTPGPEEASGERWSPVPAVARARPAAPERTREAAQTRPSIRVNLDRLDGLMNLVGELVIARSRLERRLFQLERAGDLLSFTRSRMAQTARDFERKYGNPALPVSGAANGDGLSTPVSEPLAEIFEELEFDRYDDFNILARSVSEIAEDVSEIQTQLAEFIRTVRHDTSRIQGLTGELRGEITRARMVPIGRLFARFSRQVREAARAAGKTLTLEIAGESVEMDNTMIEQISGPLLHLIQNGIIHGVESEAERVAAGKPPHGTIYLNAYHKGASIYVEVADDGRGIDAALLREHAVSAGFMRREAASLLSDREAIDLIFLPGFSTAAAVTESAGRGVGMDVVRTNVARLNGEIDVETEVGVGTRFTLKLPLTVTISDAFLVRIGDDVVAIPVTAVRRILMLRPEEIRSAGGAETVLVEEELIDLVSMHEALGVPSTPRGRRLPVLVLRVGRRSVGVAIDELLGKEEIVIKSLGDFLEGVGPFSGATIDGEGRVILLVDPARLTSPAASEEPLVARVEAVPPEAPAPITGGLPSVLLVDDSVSIRRFVRHMLERAGFSVVTANDGADALRQLDDLSVDVVITDLEMPNVNGFELIRDLRRRPATRDVPVVVLTTRAGDKHVTLARQLGVQHYVTKPVEEHSFVQLIESLTASTASGAASGAGGR